MMLRRRSSALLLCLLLQLTFHLSHQSCLPAGSRPDAGDLEDRDLSPSKQAPSSSSVSMCAAESQPEQTLEQWLAEVDEQSELQESDKRQLLDRALAAQKRFDPEEKNPELLWRLAKCTFKLASDVELTGDKARHKELLIAAEDWANKALAIDPKNGEAHGWAAYACGKLSDHLGTKERYVSKRVERESLADRPLFGTSSVVHQSLLHLPLIPALLAPPPSPTHPRRIGKGKLVQLHLEQAIAADPDKYSLHFTFGRWSMEVAKLGWVERKIAAALFDTVPEATYDDAIKHFETCDKLRPDWRASLYWKAKCFVAQKKYADAVRALDQAAKCAPLEPEDTLIEPDMLALQAKYASYR